MAAVPEILAGIPGILEANTRGKTAVAAGKLGVGKRGAFLTKGGPDGVGNKGSFRFASNGVRAGASGLYSIKNYFKKKFFKTYHRQCFHP